MTEKEQNISDVLEYGNQLALRAKTKSEFYKSGVESLSTEWTRVCSMVDERKNKLSVWSQNLEKYEDAYKGTVRNYEDFNADVIILESAALEGKEYTLFLILFYVSYSHKNF